MLCGGLHRAAFLLGEGQKRSRRRMHSLLPGNGTENAVRCIGLCSALHEPSHRTALAIAPHCISPANCGNGKSQSNGAIRPPPQTNRCSPLCPQTRSTHRSAPSVHSQTRTAMPHQKHRGLLFQEKRPRLCASPLSASESRTRNQHEMESQAHPSAFAIRTKYNFCPQMPLSTSGRSAVPDPKYRFRYQSTKSSAGRASPLSHSTRNQGLSRSGLLYSRGLPFSAFLTALPAARATASPAAVSHSIVGA